MLASPVVAAVPLSVPFDVEPAVDVEPVVVLDPVDEIGVGVPALPACVPSGDGSVSSPVAAAAAAEAAPLSIASWLASRLTERVTCRPAGRGAALAAVDVAECDAAAADAGAGLAGAGALAGGIDSVRSAETAGRLLLAGSRKPVPTFGAAVRAWWCAVVCLVGLPSVFWSSIAPPVVTTAAASSVATWLIPVPTSPDAANAPPVPATAAPPLGSCAATGSCAAAGAAPDPERVGEQRHRPEPWHERRELAADAAHLDAELAAACAVTKVAARRRVRPDATVVGENQLVADLRTGGVPSLGSRGEAHPRAHEQRLHGRDRDAEGGGELRIAHSGELAHQQGRALLLGEAADIGHEPSQRLAPLGLGDRVLDRCPDQLDQLGSGWCRAPQLVDAAVVGDAVEPCPEREIAIVRPQARVGADEHVLERVLGVVARARQHLARIREQPLAVPVVDDAERLIVPGPEQLDELFIRAQTKQRRSDGDPRPRETGGGLESGGFHVNPCWGTLTRPQREVTRSASGNRGLRGCRRRDNL